MLKWLISKFMATCPKHGCVITETITDDVFCGVCRDAENKQRIKELEHTQRAEQFLSASLRAALIQMLTEQRWSAQEATDHVNAEFTLDKAQRILEQNENQADNA